MERLLTPKILTGLRPYFRSGECLQECSLDSVDYKQPRNYRQKEALQTGQDVDARLVHALHQLPGCRHDPNGEKAGQEDSRMTSPL